MGALGSACAGYRGTRNDGVLQHTVGMCDYARRVEQARGEQTEERGREERLPDLARDLVGSSVDLIITIGTDVTKIVKSVTATIPIVMAASEDPVELGLVASLSRPGGNITGVTFISSELAAKRLELLKEIVPQVSRVAVLWNPTHVDLEMKELEPAGRSLGIKLQSVEVRSTEELDAAFRVVVGGSADAMIVVPSRMINLNVKRIALFYSVGTGRPGRDGG